MNKFIPTWLYIKQHNITGLKYFGKTTQKNPKAYKGSGLYWKDHLKIHGNNVTTIWAQLFEDKESLISFATTFSQDNNIANSDVWANLKPENGLDGFTPGHKYGVGVKHPELREYNLRPDVIARRQENNKGNTHATALKGYKQTDEHVRKRTAHQKGIERGPQTKEHIESRFIKKHCIYCNNIFSPTNFSRWHGEKCKQKK